jgi:hypothetical protein
MATSTDRRFKRALIGGPAGINARELHGGQMIARLTFEALKA